MKVAIIAIFVFLVAIVHTAPQRGRDRGLRHPRSRTILEATLHNLSNLKYRNRASTTNNKIKIKLPKLKLRNLRTKKRKRVPPRRGRRPPPRFNRDAPPPAPKPTQAPTPPPAPIIVTDAPSEPQPVVINEIPEPNPIIYETSESEQIDDTEEDGLKIFKFELSEAKPNKYPYTPVDVVSKDDPTPSPSPFYFISEDGEIFPEEITNSFQEFASVSGSDDIGDLSPFSYFSKPDSTFVGNQVQYIQEDQSVKPEAKVAEPDQPAANLVLQETNGEFYTPDIPQQNEETQDDEEVVFFYENEPQDKSSTPSSPVSYTSYTNNGGSNSQQNDYLSYPSYPPLAPAPPKPKHYGFRLLSPTSSPSTPLDLANEVDTPPNTHYKRDEVASNTPNLSYKSAYTSEDLQNEPQTLRTPDGQTFYLVSEVAEQEESQGIPKVEIPPPTSDTQPPTPSPVYYKYPNAPQKQQTPKPAPELKLPQPQKVVYYRQEENVKSAALAQPVNSPEVATTESSGAIYIQRRSTTPRVSTSTNNNLVQKTEEKAEEVATEKSSSLPIESKTEGFSFGFPAGMTFAVPQEFRTFLNTPPKWINMENW